jgi:hypothetical protein
VKIPSVFGSLLKALKPAAVGAAVVVGGAASAQLGNIIVKGLVPQAAAFAAKGAAYNAALGIAAGIPGDAVLGIAAGAMKGAKAGLLVTSLAVACSVAGEVIPLAAPRIEAWGSKAMSMLKPSTAAAVTAPPPAGMSASMTSGLDLTESTRALPPGGSLTAVSPGGFDDHENMFANTIDMRGSLP